MNSELLRAYIDRSGIKVAKVAETVGVSRQCFYNKLNNGYFLVEEAIKVSKMLRLTDEEFEQIFS